MELEKREMLETMSTEIKNKSVINRGMKASKAKIETVYKYYESKIDENKDDIYNLQIFCMKVITTNHPLL